MNYDRYSLIVASGEWQTQLVMAPFYWMSSWPCVKALASSARLLSVGGRDDRFKFWCNFSFSIVERLLLFLYIFLVFCEHKSICVYLFLLCLNKLLYFSCSVPMFLIGKFKTSYLFAVFVCCRCLYLTAAAFIIVLRFELFAAADYLLKEDC